MNSRRIEDLSEQEFRGMLDYMASEEFDRLTVAEFFDVLAAMEEEEPRETIELRATVKDGQITFLEPAPLPAPTIWMRRIGYAGCWRGSILSRRRRSGEM